MIKLSTLKIDSGEIENGAWITSPDDPEISLRVRGYRSSAFVNALGTARVAAIAALPRGASLDAKTMATIRKDVTISTCLLGAKGLENEEGTPIPEDADNALRAVFADPDYVMLYELLCWCCAEIDKPVTWRHMAA